MALWTITSKKTRPQEEVELQETEEKRSWLRIVLAVTLLALAVYGILQVLGVLSPTPANAPTEAGAAPPIIEVVTPPVVEPEPVPVVVETTTTEAITTTTTAPTTTTTTVPEPTYIWDGEADFCWAGRPARLGVLRDEWIEPGPDSTIKSVRDTILSGVFQGAYQKEITVAGDTVNAWFITMYMGEHPTTGRVMVVDFYIGGHPDTYLTRGNLTGNTIPEDQSRVTKGTCDNSNRAEIRKAEPEAIPKDLEIGRQYLFMMTVEPGEPPDNIDAHKVEVLSSFFSKSKEVIDFLNGEREDPLPADAFGWAYRVYFPNSL